MDLSEFPRIVKKIVFCVVRENMHIPFLFFPWIWEKFTRKEDRLFLDSLVRLGLLEREDTDLQECDLIGALCVRTKRKFLRDESLFLLKSRTLMFLDFKDFHVTHVGERIEFTIPSNQITPVFFVFMSQKDSCDFHFHRIFDGDVEEGDEFDLDKHPCGERMALSITPKGDITTEETIEFLCVVARESCLIDLSKVSPILLEDFLEFVKGDREELKKLSLDEKTSFIRTLWGK